jgi:hypothetical protein
MHRLLAPLSLLLTLLVSGVRAADPEPRQVLYVSEAGKFSVLLPSKPMRVTQKSMTEDGSSDIHFYIVDQQTQGLFVAYGDLPKGSVTDENRQMRLDGGRDGAIKTVNGKLLSEKKITLGKTKHEGREILIQSGDGKSFAFFRGRFYMVGDRYYQVFLLGPETFVKGKAADAFLDSFQVED